MFTKLKKTGECNVNVKSYKKVIDWDAVWGAIFIGGIAILIIANL